MAEPTPLRAVPDPPPNAAPPAPSSKPRSARRSSAPSWRPGQLSENELAELLGVSRTPVREALGAAARRAPGRDRAAARHLRHADQHRRPSATPRSSARRWSARDPARRRARASEADLAALQANLAAQDRAGDERRRRRVRPARRRLHRMLCELSGHEIAWPLAAARTATSTASAASACPSPATSARWSPSTARSSPPSPTATPTRAEARAAPPPADGPVAACRSIRAAHPDYFEEA